MASLLSLNLVFALLGSFAQASILNFPRETPVTRELDPQGWSPRPTASPQVFPELRRRVLSNAAQYALVAPDRTCGYINALSGADFACQTSTETCVFFPVTGTSLGSSSYGAVGCCTNIANCYIRTTCIDYKQYSSSSACNDACRFDANTLKCTDSASPYCGSIRYVAATAQDYYCDSVSESTWLLASTTYSGETGRTLSSVKLVATSSSTSSSTSKSTTSSASITQTDASSSATSSPAATIPSAAKSSTLIGSIVGGVLGGLVVLALFGLGALFILKKYGKNSQSAPPSELAFNPAESSDNSSGGGPVQPVEMAAAWKADIPAEPYTVQPPKPFSPQTLYQPVIAEMPAGEEYSYEKGAHQSGVLAVASPDLSVVSPASTNNRHSMGLPESLRYPDHPNGPRSA